ncbi:MAG: metallophosphoesterase [Oscillospiraceae bacterium]|nr:metallophosphoesterase [Oscillospiraceae bacterium]
MIYVMSDIHGCYGAFLQMLEQIHFSDEDDLYILGDLIDRGEAPIPLLKDCMNRVNVYPLLGNHEAIMLRCMCGLPDEATADDVEDYYTEEGFELFSAWMHNGGGVTAQQYLDLPPEQREEMLAYLQEFLIYEEIKMPDGREFILTHSGIDGFDPTLRISDYPIDALVNARPQLTDRFYEDKMLIFGHTPTLIYPHSKGLAEVLFTETYINIDCGAVFHEGGGRLACLRLDDMEVFYV